MASMNEDDEDVVESANVGGGIAKRVMVERKLTTVQRVQRNEEVKEMLLAGYSNQQAIKFVMEKYGNSWNSAYNAIRKVLKDISECIYKNKEDEIKFHIARRERIVRKAEMERDYRLALQADESIGKLKGLDIDRVDHTTQGRAFEIIIGPAANKYPEPGKSIQSGVHAPDSGTPGDTEAIRSS